MIVDEAAPHRTSFMTPPESAGMMAMLGEFNREYSAAERLNSDGMPGFQPSPNIEVVTPERF